MAARAFQLITVGSQLIEGIGVEKGEVHPQPRISLAVPSSENDPLVHLLQQFDQQLQEVSWQNAPVLLVVPTSEISIRRLEFPFSDPKKIAQALVFELENELLEDVSTFAYDHIILPQRDGTAEVLVYLISRDFLQALVNVCLARNIVPFQATFSAQAMALTHPPASGLHYYVYSGPDESYVACMNSGKFVTVLNFPLDLSALAATGDAEGPENRQEIIRMALNGGENGRQEGPPATMEGPLHERLREALTVLCRDIEQFLGPHSLGEPFTLSLHGRFGGLLAWDANSATLSLPPQEPGLPAGNGEGFFGALGELLGNPAAIASGHAVNFHRQKAGWFNQLREFRKPLVAMGVLMVLCVTFFVSVQTLRIGEARARLAEVEGEVQKILKAHLPGTHGPAAGVKLLEDRVAKGRKNLASAARFEEYGYDTLGLLMGVSEVFRNFPTLSLRSLTVNSERVTLDGNTDSYDASESLKNRLAQIEPFKGKEPVVTHQKRGEQIVFRIVVQR